MKLKVCGVTNLRDAQMIVQRSVDYLGFIKVANTPRYVDDTVAAELIALCQQHHITPVAVWRNPPLEQVQAFAAKFPNCWLQFHGEESAAMVSRFDNTIKTITIDAAGLPNVDQNSYPNSHYVLFDSVKLGQGIKGQSFDGTKAKITVDKFSLAGGINPSNIEQLCQNILPMKPFCIDASSGIEATVGKKSMILLDELIAKIKLIA